MLLLFCVNYIYVHSHYTYRNIICVVLANGSVWMLLPPSVHRRVPTEANSNDGGNDSKRRRTNNDNNTNNNNDDELIQEHNDKQPFIVSQHSRQSLQVKFVFRTNIFIKKIYSSLKRTM